MTTLTRRIQETYFYKEVRKTPVGAGVKYPGYPIFHLYKNKLDGTEMRLDEKEYWLPLQGLRSYREYTLGDENVDATRIQYEQSIESFKRPNKRKYTDSFPVYTHKYHGLKLYVATNRVKRYPLNQKTNPYSYTNIQVWVESPETYTNTYDEYGNLIFPTFWYHPFSNAFYPFGNLNTYGLTDSQYLIDTIFTRDTSGQSNDALMANVVESIKLAQVDELISQGRSRAEAIALVDSNSQEALSTRAAQSLITPGQVSSRRPAAPGNISVNVRQSIARSSSTGISSGAGVTVPTSQPPKLIQTTTSGQPQLTYEFIHRPNQISYSNIGSEWAPIDRAANRPMVDWKSYKLMNVSLSFIVAPDESGSLDEVIDGKVISTSVDEQLKKLRKMASSPFPVVFMGFDKLLEEPTRYPFNNDAGKGSLFVIADFSVTSIYRSSTGSISRASCDMTLTEYPKELIKLIEFPKLKPIPELPPPPPGQKEICDNTLASLTHGRNGAIVQESSVKSEGFLRALAKKDIIIYKKECSSIAVLDVAAYEEAVGLYNRMSGGGIWTGDFPS
jgi:hypothetical protein